jgi:hypothetical protein
VGKPEGNRPLGRLRHRWEDNFKMVIPDVQCGGGRARNGSMWLRIGTGGGLFECGNEHSDSIKCGKFLD